MKNLLVLNVAYHCLYGRYHLSLTVNFSLISLKKLLIKIKLNRTNLQLKL